jgi:hypothetical protein
MRSLDESAADADSLLDWRVQANALGEMTGRLDSLSLFSTVAINSHQTILASQISRSQFNLRYLFDGAGRGDLHLEENAETRITRQTRIIIGC